MDLTHASFFSGVGGLDLGLERAGWRTVSFSEIDSYASAVLAQRWPGVPNIGDIVPLAAREGRWQSAGVESDSIEPSRFIGRVVPWHGAALWSGGFPCQDLSVAGKRRGFAGARSGLAFAFLDLAAVHRPRFILLENVPGLLSSHGGRDMAALLGALVELGYGVGYRVLDARYFGVPQRRRRVFILGITPGGRAGAERAAEVLSVGSRCRWHPPTGVEAGEDAAAGTRGGVDHARTITGTSWKRHDEDIDTLIPTIRSHPRPGSNSDGLLVRQASDPDGVRATDGLAGRSHDRDGVADTLRVGGRASGAGDSYDNTPWIVNALDQRRGGVDDNEAQAGHLVTERCTCYSDLVISSCPVHRFGLRRVLGPLLPLGLDSHRYRCCGNGVVSSVAEWIGLRLAAVAS